MLDAHPQIQIANDSYHFEPTNDIVQTLLDGSAARADKLFYPHTEKWDGSNAPDHCFQMPGWYQGRNDGDLRVVGFKSAHSSVAMHDSDDLDLVNRTVLKASGLAVKMLVPLRNPYDTISSLAHLFRVDQPSRISYWMDDYERHLSVVDHYSRIVGWGSTRLTFHEELVAAPKGFLDCILSFLGLDAPAGYLDASAAMVSPEKRETRYLYGEWSDAEKARMEAIIASRGYLSRYVGSFA